ncbi:MAG: Uma2 family endonuclease [Thiofilum sp.]|uniref:Uma2 family endonuclease n=1 Tax=Thiofilum sp. TaxID=2212733 RepID=UPI0025D68172|nr:Uma2 family endonuclease [Thiofilum sp.]MBK8454056.1 Uma2 family endonuclease [Thiofilum sp.]
MSAIANIHYTTPEVYLLGENERIDGTKYEYVNGQIYAMAGESRNHNRITRYLTTTIDIHLRGSRCEVFQGDMKIGIQSINEQHFYYPDVHVTCEEENNRYFNTSPCLIIEVLSESTARIDRYEKLVAYKLIPTLQEYLLCAQDSPLVEIYRKRNEWRAEYFLAGQSFTLDSIGLTLAVNDIYEFLITPPTHPAAH